MKENAPRAPDRETVAEPLARPPTAADEIYVMLCRDSPSSAVGGHRQPGSHARRLLQESEVSGETINTYCPRPVPA